MKLIDFGETGVSLSKIGLGTVQFGMDYGYTTRKTQDEVNRLLAKAQNYRINYLDTASEYGDSELKIGRYLKNHPNSFYIFTKLKKMPSGHLSAADTRDAVRSSVQQSLANLGISCLDFLLLHQSEKEILSNAEIFNSFSALKSEGLIRGAGVSVYAPDEIEYVLTHYASVIDFFQVPANIFDRRFDEILKKLKHLKYGVICRSVFLKGLIPCELSDVPDTLAGIKPFKSKLQLAADKMNLNPKELALLYIADKEGITSMILGVDTWDELKEDVDILEHKAHQYVAQPELDELEVYDEVLIDPRKWTEL